MTALPARRARTDARASSALLARQALSLHRRGQVESAVDGYRAALELDPRRPGIWFALGCAESARRARGEAVRCLRRALALRPAWPLAEYELGKALFGLGDVDRAAQLLERAASSRTAPDVRRAAASFLAVIIPGSSRADHAAVLEARRRFARLALPEPQRRPGPRRPGDHSSDKVRVGYVSAFFGSRNWMKPVWGVVNHHDRERFDVHLFADGPLPDSESGYDADPRDRVHRTTGLSNERLARRVARAGVDVLVDLNAYSAPERLGLYVLRPARFQVGWFNTYASSGIGAFDCVVGDDAVVRPGEERFFAERVRRVPGSYLAFSTLYPCPEVAPPPCLERGKLTFGSFCSHYKLTNDVVSAWASILRGAPGARLLLKNRALDDASTRVDLGRRFARRGVEAARLSFEGSAEHEVFLGAYAQVDVALDAFPYSGGTTTMEALWQGVPVLTFDGDRWASRTSSSLLLAAGLGDWVAPDRRGYVERAVALARARGTPGALAVLRKAMRERLRTSPACDSAGLARALESLYRELVAGDRPARRRVTSPA
jgi:protein O-GlcNAc transferase